MGKCQVPSASVRIFPSCVVKHPTHTLAASKAYETKQKEKREPTFKCLKLGKENEDFKKFIVFHY